MSHAFRIPALVLMAAAAALSCAPAFAIGRFAYVQGSVTVVDASGAQRTPRPGDRINEKETIHVGDGRAQIRFDDKGWVALEPRTVFEVREYSQKDSNVTLSLIKGGLRAVTGLLADRNPTRFRMDTVVATIGIRGTSFQAKYCLASCNVPDGLYVTGGDGTTFVRNPMGEIDLARGRTAFVANLQTPPQETNVKPVGAVPPPTTAQEMASVGSTTPGELRPGNFIYFEGAAGFLQPFQTLSLTSAGGGVAGSGTGAVTASGILRGEQTTRSLSLTDAGIIAGAGTAGPGESVSVTLDALQRPVSITASNSAGERASITALNVPQLAFNDGTLFWGRWTNAKFNFDIQASGENSNAFGTADLPAGSYLHYIFGIPASSVPLNGSATYTFTGGSGSTSIAGTVGDGLTSGTLTANFGLNRVTASNLIISHGGTYTAGGTAQLAPGNRAQFATQGFAPFIGSATGPTGTHNFKFEGFFAGTPAPLAPPRAGVVWQIERPDAIVGTGAFRCSAGC